MAGPRADGMPKQVERGSLRLKVGSMAFRSKRYASWYFGRTKYATRPVHDSATIEFRYSLIQHRSPLYRQLRNVDMWLQENKVQNLRLAVDRLHGVVLRPGETLSFWRMVGRPSRRKGYLPGMVLVNGGFRPGVGGGLCQLSNLIYWMTLHTPLTVTERYRHQYDVFPDANRTLPFGSGATVSYNYIDLQIANRTTQPFALRLEVGEFDLRGEWRSDRALSQTYEVYERSHAITQLPSGTYVRHNQIWRRVSNQDGELVADHPLVDNHAFMMYSPLLPQAAPAQV